MFLRGISSVIGLLLVACNIQVASAEEQEKEVTIVQEKLFFRHHEVGMSAGSIPDDKFYEIFPISLNYTYHFNEHFAWEVFRGSYMLNAERDLKKDLENDFGATPQTFDELTSTFETNFIIKPTYGKDSVWNKWILNHETFIALGMGIANYEQQRSYGGPESESSIMANVGIGRKYFVGENANVSLELRHMTIFKSDDTENNLYLGIGFNYRFDMFSGMKESDDSTSSLYKYLDE